MCPEGPEVKRTQVQLDSFASTRTIKDVIILSGRYDKKEPDGFKDFLDAGPHTVKAVHCKGKFIWFEMEGSDWTIWNTLGMSGNWSKAPGDHVRVLLAFDDGKFLCYNDMRNFGTMKFVKGQKKLEAKLASLGPDVLAGEVTFEEFKKLLERHSNKTLAQFLMNQKIIAGVGNYLKAEILYFSKLSPHRKCDSLNETETKTLRQMIHKTIRDSYASGGVTIKTYTDLFGKTGSFGERFTVYRRASDPHGNEVVSEETKDKRTTWWVPSVQK